MTKTIIELISIKVALNGANYFHNGGNKNGKSL